MITVDECGEVPLAVDFEELAKTLTIQRQLCEAACAFVLREGPEYNSDQGSARLARLRDAVDNYKRMIGER